VTALHCSLALSREEKLKQMVENYTMKRDHSGNLSLMEFHRKHLVLFLNRFRQFLGRFRTPSSALLSHELFLVVEAATIVAKSDWVQHGALEANRNEGFSQYFKAFEELASGLAPLDETAAACLEALEAADNC
jgi:hypothetical protein